MGRPWNVKGKQERRAEICDSHPSKNGKDGAPRFVAGGGKAKGGSPATSGDNLGERQNVMINTLRKLFGWIFAFSSAVCLWYAILHILRACQGRYGPMRFHTIF